jgi:hypothetical protein
MRVRVSISFAVLLCCACVFGQDAPSRNRAETFHVEGTIKDPLDAVIQGATITFQSEKLSRTVTTNNVGFYEAVLPLGDYTMTAQSRGFRPYRRPLFRVASPLNVRFEIVLPVEKLINRIVVGTETGPLYYYGEESFSVPSKEGVPFQLYIRYGGLRSATGETLDYRGDKTKYDDSVFVAYNLFSLQADRVIYDVKNRTITATGNVVVVDESGKTQRVGAIDIKLDDGQAMAFR